MPNTEKTLAGNIRRKLGRFLTKHQWVYKKLAKILVEFTVILAGVLAAFYLDGWREERKKVEAVRQAFDLVDKNIREGIVQCNGFILSSQKHDSLNILYKEKAFRIPEDSTDIKELNTHVNFLLLDFDGLDYLTENAELIPGDKQETYRILKRCKSLYDKFKSLEDRQMDFAFDANPKEDLRDGATREEELRYLLENKKPRRYHQVFSSLSENKLRITMGLRNLLMECLNLDYTNERGALEINSALIDSMFPPPIILEAKDALPIDSPLVALDSFLQYVTPFQVDVYNLSEDTLHAWRCRMDGGEKSRMPNPVSIAPMAMKSLWLENGIYLDLGQDTITTLRRYLPARYCHVLCHTDE